MRNGLFVCVWLVIPAFADAQVKVHLKNGQTFIGESIVKEDDKTLEVKVCHSHSQRIPTSQVARHESMAATRPVRVTAAAQPAPAAVSTPEQFAARQKLIAEFFAQPDRRAEVLAQLRQADAVSPDDVGRYADAIFAAAREGLKLREGDFVFGHPRYAGEVHVEVHPRPAATTSRATTSQATTSQATTSPADAYSLVLLLHGGGEGDGNWRSGAGMFIGSFRKQLGRVIFICPTVLRKKYAEWGSNPDEEAYVKELMKAARRTWPIDTDRVYCAGYSMGGYGTWHFGGHQADVFAGLVSGAGGILLGMRRGETWGWGVLSNLMHTPIFFAHARDDGPSPVWSDQVSDRILTELGQRAGDGAYPHKYVEYPNGGHGAATRGMGDGVKWVTAFKRNPHPKRIAWEPSRPFIRHFYWLHVDQPRFFTRIEGTISGNTIDLKLTGVTGAFSVFLNDQLLDLGKPVTIRCDGQMVFEGVVRPSISAVLQSVEDKLDPRMWYSARIDLTAAAK